MSADTQLREIYKEWRRLAETEGEAIRTRNWALVADCQKALQRLRPQITALTREAQEEWTRLGLDRESRQKHFQALVTELIGMESRNNALLQSVREAAQAQVRELEQAGHLLRQVQKLYAPSRPAAWTSFS